MQNLLMEQAFIWIDALASTVIFLAVLKLYETNRHMLYLGGRVFLASIASSAIYSTFEVLAWRRSIPLGMSLFLVLLASGWALRAFCPALMCKIFPPGTGMTGVAAARQNENNPSFALRH